MSLPSEGGSEVLGLVGTRSPATESWTREAHAPWLRSRTHQLTHRHVEEHGSFFWPSTSSIGVAIPFSGQGDLVLGLWDFVLGTRRRSSSLPLNDQICQLHPPSLLSTSPLQPKFLSSISDKLPSSENLDADRGIATIHRRLRNRVAFWGGVRNTKESLSSLLLRRSKSRNLHCFDVDPVGLLFLETGPIWVSRTLLFSHLGRHVGKFIGRVTVEARAYLHLKMAPIHFPSQLSGWENFRGEKERESRVL